MNPVLTTGAAVLTLAALLALTHVPLGTWIHRVFTDDAGLARRAARLPRSSGSTPAPSSAGPATPSRWSPSRWSRWPRLFLLIEVQGWLPWSLGRSMDWHTAVNTAVSFMSNTNWQSYAGEAGDRLHGAGRGSDRAELRLRRRRAWPSRSRWSAASRATAPTGSATSGSTWCAASSASCCRWPSSRRSCCSSAASSRTSRTRTTITTVTGGAAGRAGRPGRLAGGDQGARHQRRWLLQRQLRPPVREPQRLDQPVRDLPAARHPVLAARTPTAGWWATSARAMVATATMAGLLVTSLALAAWAELAAAARARWARWRARSSASASRGRRSSPEPRPAPPPVRSTRCTTASARSAGRCRCRT